MSEPVKMIPLAQKVKGEEGGIYLFGPPTISALDVGRLLLALQKGPVEPDEEEEEKATEPG